MRSVLALRAKIEDKLQDLRGGPRGNKNAPAAAWYLSFSVFCFSAHSAEKQNTEKYRSAEGYKHQ